MIKGKTILAIVPARGGSKGIPLKNLQKVKGKTLIEYVANVIKNIKEIDKSIVSTDNKKISQISKLNGIEAPFLRPKNLSGDTISDLAVLKHALIKIEKIYRIKYDIILMLQPTSPLRTSNVVKECLYKLHDIKGLSFKNDIRALSRNKNEHYFELQTKNGIQKHLLIHEKIDNEILTYNIE